MKTGMMTHRGIAEVEKLLYFAAEEESEGTTQNLSEGVEAGMKEMTQVSFPAWHMDCHESP